MGDARELHTLLVEHTTTFAWISHEKYALIYLRRRGRPFFGSVSKHLDFRIKNFNFG